MGDRPGTCSRLYRTDSKGRIAIKIKKQEDIS